MDITRKSFAEHLTGFAYDEEKHEATEYILRLVRNKKWLDEKKREIIQRVRSLVHREKKKSELKVARYLKARH